VIALRTSSDAFRIVDDHPDGDHQPRQQHDVDRDAVEVEEDDRRDERQRDRDEADQRRAPLEQERRQDQHDEQAAEQQRRREVVDRGLDEARRPEDRRVDRDVGQARAHRVHGVLEALRQLQRVGARVLLDDEQQARAVVDDRVAAERLVLLLERRDVGDAQALAVAALDDDLAEVGSAVDADLVADIEAHPARLDEAALADERAVGEPQQPGVQRVAGRVHDLVQRHAVAGELPRVDLDVLLLQALAPDGDVRDPGHAQQALADLPVGDRRQLGRRDLVGRQPDLHDAARRRDGRHHERRRRERRQRRRDRGHPLLDELARAHLVRAAPEDELDRGQVGDRLGAQLLEPVDAVELLLERDRDELLDLRGGVARRERLDLDARRRELGEHVDLGAADLRRARDEQRDRAEEDEPAEAQAGGDDPSHEAGGAHSSTPNSAL
jgi:hypothetical protein